MSNVIGVLTLVVTAVYAYLTYRIVKASKEQAEAIFRPYITVTHRLATKTLISLCIRNTGKTNAQNLRLHIDKSFYQIGRKDFNIAEHFAFNNIIESFPPESELTFALMSSLELQSRSGSKEGQPPVFTITATYSYSDRTVTEKTSVDLRPYDNTFMPDPSVQESLEELTKQVAELKDILKKKLADQPAA